MDNLYSGTLDTELNGHKQKTFMRLEAREGHRREQKAVFRRQEGSYRGEGLNESKAFQLNCVSMCGR